jgi:hypothetical protein
MLFRFDVNLIGILVSSIIICICLLIEYLHTDFAISLPCDSPPTVTFLPLANITAVLVSKINSSQQRILIYASGSYPNDFLGPLQAAKDRSVLVSLIVPQNEAIATSIKTSGLNVTQDPNASANFVVIDDTAYHVPHLFESENYSKVLFTSLPSCSGAVSDLVSFFDFRYRNLTDAHPPRIISLSSHAKTSLIAPLKIGGTSDTLYFFHNPDGSGDPVRISSADLLPQTFYLNTADPKANVSIFCDHVPSPTAGDGFSLFTVVKRVLIALTNADDPLSVRLLVPRRWAAGNHSRWLNATVAFRQADMRLYDERWEGANFIVIENHAFVFSHGIKDEAFRLLGFHMATTAKGVVDKLNQFWDNVWENATTYAMA